MLRSDILHCQRQSLVLIEKAHIHVDDNNNVIYNTAIDTEIQSFNLPWRNVAVLLIGQDASVSNAAMTKLSESNVMVAFCGSSGSPLIMASHNEGCHAPSTYLRPWIELWSDPNKILSAAKSFQTTKVYTLEKFGEKADRFFDYDDFEDAASRFKNKIKSINNIEGVEYIKYEFNCNLYKSLAKKAKINDFEIIKNAHRIPDKDIDYRLKSVNIAIDYGNHIAKSFSSLALWVLGIPANMSISGYDKQFGSLVDDVTETFQDAFVLPIAFGMASKVTVENPFDEEVFRQKLFTAFRKTSSDNSGVISIAIKAVKDAIASANLPVPENGAD